MALEVEAADFRAVEQRADTGRGQHGQEVVGEIPGAETVHGDVDLYAAFGRFAQGAGDLMADFIVGEDVAFEVDLDLCPGNRGQQGREVVSTRIEQGQPVARQDTQRPCRDRWPRGAAWSEMLDHGQAVVYLGALDIEAAHVDAVEAEHRHRRREAAGRPMPARAAEYFAQGRGDG